MEAQAQAWRAGGRRRLERGGLEDAVRAGASAGAEDVAAGTRGRPKDSGGASVGRRPGVGAGGQGLRQVACGKAGARSERGAALQQHARALALGMERKALALGMERKDKSTKLDYRVLGTPLPLIYCPPSHPAPSRPPPPSHPASLPLAAVAARRHPPARRRHHPPPSCSPPHATALPTSGRCSSARAYPPLLPSPRRRPTAALTYAVALDRTAVALSELACPAARSAELQRTTVLTHHRGEAMRRTAATPSGSSDGQIDRSPPRRASPASKST
uniref:Uncharacterized protein n=1 Tax=Setaria viridis TaxID=4556 RepID=A0A4U6TU32_SETVI|nr:hypothetical protein SEVIR_7G248900v2 [Setaria viridis]